MRTSSLLTLGLLLFAGFFARPLAACGYSLLGEQYRVALLNPYIAGSEYSAFFYSSEQLNHWENAQDGRDRRSNVEDWARELGGGVTGDDVMRILYGTRLPDWQAAATGRPGEAFQNNPAWVAIQRRPELLNYALWAKGYEVPHRVYNWWDEPEEEAEDPTDYPALALTGYEKAKEGSFLKERYAYQLLLLAYYAEDGTGMETYFNRHFRDKAGVLADWARFHFAGQWNDEGRYVVEMANAFRAVPEKAIAAHQRTPDQLDPRDYLAAARTDTERANLYALAALKRKGPALEYLREAYRLDPTNPVLALLAVREVNKLEDWLLSYRLTGIGPALPNFTDPDWGDNYEAERAKLRAESEVRDRAYVKEVREFFAQLSTPDPRLADVLRGQLALLDEDYDAALKHVRRTAQRDDALGFQISVIRYLASIQSQRLSQEEKGKYLAENLPVLLEHLKPATEEEQDYWEANPENNRAAALVRIASQQYAAAGDTVTAYFLHIRSLDLPIGYEWASEYYALIDYLDRPISDPTMRRVIQYAAGEGPNNALTRFLNPAAQVDVNALRDLAGTLALRRNELATALEHFSAIPADWHATNYAFADYLKTSPLSDVVNPSVKFPGKAEVVRQLLALQANAGQANDAGAAACLALAKAWYLMSDFGPAWMMLRYGKSSTAADRARPWPASSEMHAAVPHTPADFALIYEASRVDEYLDCAEAVVKDRELAAEVAFVRAALGFSRWKRAIELENGYWYYDADGKLAAKQKKQYRESFAPVARDYAKTDFFQRTLRQCSWVKAVM